MSDVSIDPTHAVVFGGLTAHPNRERSVTAEAIATAARRADRVCVLLDDEGVAEAYPGIVDRLRKRYECTDERGDCREFATRDVEDVDVLANLLRRPTWHLPVLVSHVRLEREGRPVLLYNADHRQFDLDADVAPSCVEAVAETFEGVGAGVLPKRSLCRWEVDGTSYDLVPPNFCVGRTCFGLSPLRAAEPDRDALTIRLRWADGSATSRLVGLLGGVLDRLAPPRPRELAFDDEAQFETAAAEFERVLGTIRS